ncbi:MAG: hypothetical protein A2Y62_13585 [Candidatus Fischerbacteria bacterium RBG_13_37_8]|uniref:Uncharacterized protein n=1 Tax=Candidatus Fischerbacteria bacterium RBG_13_37_8 TaxID=1817863 RepID=A0A1F5V6V0_9BACT|nr:MAG: hypothetical protein A2Y62_13585 [Candidatus Fischerbacteria bacterium RBG_13_37_8]
MRNKTILLILLFAACNALAIDMGDPMYFHFPHWSSCWLADPGSDYSCGTTAHHINANCTSLGYIPWAWVPTEAGDWDNEPECEYTPIIRATGCYPTVSCNVYACSGGDVFFRGPFEGNTIPHLKYGVAPTCQANTACTVWTIWLPSGAWSVGESWLNMSYRQSFVNNCNTHNETCDFSSGLINVISLIAEKPYYVRSGGFRNCMNVSFENDAILVENVAICSKYNPAVGCIEVGYPPVGSAAEYQWFVKNEGLAQLRIWTFTGIKYPGSVDCSGTSYYKDENDYQWCWLTGWAVSTHPYQAKKPSVLETGTCCWWGEALNPDSCPSSSTGPIQTWDPAEGHRTDFCVLYFDPIETNI